MSRIWHNLNSAYSQPSTNVSDEVKVGTSQKSKQEAKGNSEGAGVINNTGGRSWSECNRVQTVIKLGIIEEC